jgi:hypothetical protein
MHYQKLTSTALSLLLAMGLIATLASCQGNQETLDEETAPTEELSPTEESSPTEGENN